MRQYFSFLSSFFLSIFVHSRHCRAVATHAYGATQCQPCAGPASSPKRSISSWVIHTFLAWGIFRLKDRKSDKYINNAKFVSDTNLIKAGKPNPDLNSPQ